jgi:hypothetical protein
MDGKCKRGLLRKTMVVVDKSMDENIKKKMEYGRRIIMRYE